MFGRSGRSTSSTAAWLWLPVAFYMAVIFYVSSLSVAPLPPGVSDKGAHSFGYSGLAVLVTRALAHGLPSRITGLQALGAIVISAAYGATDEWHQRYVPGRSPDLRDIFADASGAVIGTAACWAWGIISLRTHPNPR